KVPRASARADRAAPHPSGPVARCRAFSGTEGAGATCALGDALACHGGRSASSIEPDRDPPEDRNLEALADDGGNGNPGAASDGHGGALVAALQNLDSLANPADTAADCDSHAEPDGDDTPVTHPEPNAHRDATADGQALVHALQHPRAVADPADVDFFADRDRE